MEKELEDKLAVAELCGALEHLDSLRKSIRFARVGLKLSKSEYAQGQVAAFIEVEDSITEKIVSIKKTLKASYNTIVSDKVEAVM